MEWCICSKQQLRTNSSPDWHDTGIQVNQPATEQSKEHLVNSRLFGLFRNKPKTQGEKAVIIRLSYLIAIITFVISFLFFGNGYAQAIQTGASWGFWTVLILGGPICLFVTVTSLTTTIAGGAVGYKVAGIFGSIMGTLGVAGTMTLIILAPIISFSLAIAGYDAIGDWGATNLENNSLVIRGVVLLGLGFLMSAIRKK